MSPPQAGRPATAADAGQADDAAGGDDLTRVGDDLADAGALHDDIGLKPMSATAPVW